MPAALEVDALRGAVVVADFSFPQLRCRCRDLAASQWPQGSAMSAILTSQLDAVPRCSPRHLVSATIIPSVPEAARRAMLETPPAFGFAEASAARAAIAAVPTRRPTAFDVRPGRQHVRRRSNGARDDCRRLRRLRKVANCTRSRLSHPSSFAIQIARIASHRLRTDFAQEAAFVHCDLMAREQLITPKAADRI